MYVFTVVLLMCANLVLEFYTKSCLQKLNLVFCARLRFKHNRLCGRKGFCNNGHTLGTTMLLVDSRLKDKVYMHYFFWEGGGWGAVWSM